MGKKQAQRDHLAPGFPVIPIDWEQFDKLCALHCTLEEFANYFNCSIDTIEDRVLKEHGVRFSDYLRQKSGSGKISLRRKQYQTAMSGNVTMMIWLGKQWLGQSDKQEISGNEHNPIVLKYSLDDDESQDAE